ncbi:MAG: hypothetical protein ABSH04_06260, partial [Acidimicrobiales bacterium]
AVLLFWPASPVDTSRLPDGGFGDPAQTVWYLAWVPYALGHGLPLFHSNLVNTPNGVDLANNASVPLLGLIGAPITVTLGPVASFNLLLRLAFAASAGSMFLVLRQWCTRWPIAFVGGLIYGFSPYMVSQGQGGAHLHQTFTPLVPLIVWCAYELLVVQHRRPARMGLLLGAAAGAQALIAPEVLSDLVIVLLLTGAIAMVVVRKERWRSWAGHALRGAAVGVTVFIVIAGDLLWWMLLANGHVHGPVQPTAALQPLSGDLLSPVVPTSQQLIAPSGLASLAAKFAAGSASEGSGYLGLPFVGLVIGVGIAWRREAIIRWAGGAALVAFVLSLGSRLSVTGHTTAIPLPEAVFAHLPVLDSTVPARFALMVVLFACIIVAVGVERTWGWVASHGSRWRRRVGAGVLVTGAVSLLAMAPVVPFATAAPDWPPSVQTALRTIPPGATVLTYPYPIRWWSETMLWQAVGGMRFRILGGYVTVQGQGTGENVPKLTAPASVQEFLVQNQGGVGVPYPIIPPDAATSADLCAYLNLNLVGAVVYWGAGPGAPEVLTYFTHALGAPSSDTNGVLIWRIPGAGWCAQ